MLCVFVRGATLGLFELAHEVGGRLGGLFDFDEAALAGGVVRDMLGEQVGVRGDDAKKIIEGMRDGLGARTGSGVGKGEGGDHGGILSGLGIRMKVREGREDGGQKGIGIEILESQSMGRTDVRRFVGEVSYGRGIEGQDGERRIFGAHFVDVMKALKIPGMNVEGDGVPAATGQDQEQFVERLGPMSFDAGARSGSEGLREPGPSTIFAQVEKMER